MRTAASWAANPPEKNAEGQRHGESVDRGWRQFLGRLGLDGDVAAGHPAGEEIVRETLLAAAQSATERDPDDAQAADAALHIRGRYDLHSATPEAAPVVS